jgi:hypothetical protein
MEKTDFIKINRSELSPMMEVVKYIDEGQSVPIVFGKDGLELKTLNSSGSCVCEAKIRPKDFLAYNIAKPFSISLDLNLLHRILKKMSGYELAFGVKDGRFEISDSESRWQIPIFAEDKESKCPNIDTLVFDVNFETDKKELYEVLSSANILSNEISLEVNGNAKFFTKNHNGDFEKTLKLKTDKKNKKTISASFLIEHLKKLCERGSYGEIKVGLSKKAILLAEPNLRIVIASITGEDGIVEEDYDDEEE